MKIGTKSAGGPVGLDLDGAYIAAVQMSGGQIQRAVSDDLATGLVTDGEVSDIAGLSAALRDFFKRNRLPRRVRLGVANEQIVVRSLTLPHIEDAGERSVAVRFQAAEAIPMPLDEVVLDHQVVGETTADVGAARMHVLVVAARESMVARVVEAVRGAGLKPASIDLNAFALVRALATPSADDEDARVYCHLAGVTNLAIAIGSKCLFTRPLSPTGDEVGDPLPASLAEQIRMSIDFYMAQPGARPVRELVLSGPRSGREGLMEELSGLIALPASAPGPLENLGAGALPSAEDPRRHTVAAGLALGAAA